MTAVLSTMSLFFIPVIFTIIIASGLIKKAPVYDYFIEGAKEGLRSAAGILPFIIAIFIGIEALVSSGAMDFLEKLAAPVLNLLHIPEELTSLILLRPVSGSGSLVVVQEILETYGADSFIGRSAAAMAGSCETIFYVIAVYFGVTSVKKVRHGLTAGVAGYAAGVAASVIVCSIMW